MAPHSLCDICGKEEEMGFHVVIRCPHARDLREALHNSMWLIPEESRLLLRTKLAPCTAEYDGERGERPADVTIVALLAGSK